MIAGMFVAIVIGRRVAALVRNDRPIFVWPASVRIADHSWYSVREVRSADLLFCYFNLLF